MGRFDRFDAEVGRDQGATRLFVTTDGFFNVGDVQGGANGTDITGSQLRNIFLTDLTRYNINNSAGVLSVIQIPTLYGYVYFSCTTAASQASANLPSAEKGATLILWFKGVQSNLSLLKGNAISIEGIRGSDLSCFNVINGSVNSAFVELICFTQGCWSVAFYSNGVGIVEQPST